MVVQQTGVRLVAWSCALASCVALADGRVRRSGTTESPTSRTPVMTVVVTDRYHRRRPRCRHRARRVVLFPFFFFSWPAVFGDGAHVKGGECGCRPTPARSCLEPVVGQEKEKHKTIDCHNRVAHHESTELASAQRLWEVLSGPCVSRLSMHCRQQPSRLR
jgi:hypothetical protein